MATKQDFFMKVLEEKGGEATTKEMMIALDENKDNVRNLAKHLERRRKIIITVEKYKTKPYRMYTFKVNEKKWKKWQSEAT